MNNKIIFMVCLLISCGVAPRQKALGILREGIKDESMIIRVNAAKGLKQIGDTEGIKVLYEILKGNDRDAVVASISALYDLKEQAFSPVLVQLAQSKIPLVRAEAYRLIAVINNEECRDILIKGIDDKIAKIRRSSYFGLEKFKGKKIIRNGLRDIDPFVRITAAKALVGLGETGMENFVRKEMKVTNIELWKHGVSALAEMGDTSAIPFIKELISDTPWELRIVAAEALFILGNQDGISVLKSGLKSNDPFARIQVVGILKKHHIPETFELLKEAIHDEFINVSIGAIEALATYWTKECKELFEEMMNAPNPLVKIAAAAAYLKN